MGMGSQREHVLRPFFFFRFVLLIPVYFSSVFRLFQNTLPPLLMKKFKVNTGSHAIVDTRVRRNDGNERQIFCKQIAISRTKLHYAVQPYFPYFFIDFIINCCVDVDGGNTPKIKPMWHHLVG